MLKVTNIQKPAGQRYDIRVHITGVTDETDHDLAAAAMAAAHESPGRLFGYHVSRYEDTPESVSVALHRD